MDQAYVGAHIEEDREHWWFRGRLAVLLAALRASLPRRRLRLLELGSGTGNVLRALGEFGEAIGMEPDARLVAVALANGLDVRRGLRTLSATSWISMGSTARTWCRFWARRAESAKFLLVRRD